MVKSANQPIPGATVTATIGDQKRVTTTDQNGHYAFAGASAGDCSIEVRMFGFDTATKKSACAETAKIDFTLQLQESPMAQRMARMGGAQGGGNQLEAQLQSEMTVPEAAAPGAPQVDGQSGSDAFQVSGSLSQGLAQNAQPDFGMMMGGPGGFGGPGGGQGGPGGAPGGGFGGPGGGGFGGPGGGGFGGRGGGQGGPGGGNRAQGQGRPGAQFGNRRAPSQIHGMAFMTLANSVVNAKPFSFTGQESPQPPYASARFGFLVGGPLVIPKIVKDTSTFFYLNYTGTRSRQPYAAVETVPTAQERTGDFSQALQTTGPVQIFYPGTSTPFPNSTIPGNLLNPIALKLLDSYIPLPNQPGTVSNYQYFASPPNNSDNLNGRVMRNLNQKDRLAYHLSYQRRDADNAQPFAFFDTVAGYGIQTDLTWTHNFTPTTIFSSMVSFNRNRSETTPFFAYGTNVAAELGIAGTSANPIDYGPPNLNFTNFGPLSDGQPVLTRNQSQGLTESVILTRGKHTLTLGAQYSRNDTSTTTQQNGRGTFNFNGQATSELGANGLPVQGTGLDFADFLLGMPQSASIQYSPAMYFTQNVATGFLLDDWKLSANLTVNLGLRYEFFAPLQEKYGDMANLDIAPGFTNVAVATPAMPGPYSGSFPAALINPDYRDVSPRLGLAYKVPFIKRSTIIRAGYGIYYNGQSYIPFGLDLAQQAPFAVSQTVNASPTVPLTLETGLLPLQPAAGAAAVISNTFAVDRFYRTPYAQTWNATIQHDLGSGFFMEVGYLGTKGTHLDVLTLPGAGPTPSPSGFQLGNAAGFIYDAPVGSSSYNALQTHLMRRLRGGISMNARYNFSKSIDNVSSFGGVAVGGAGRTVAQNWQDLAAEYGLSSFNRTSVFTMSFVYTSPFGNPNSRFASSGWDGRLLRNWTLSGGVTAESGIPLTARVLGNETELAQTGGLGYVRPDATGQPVFSGSGMLNPAAFAVPPSGQFGNAGRDTIPGPNLVSVNAAFGRSFQFGDTRRRLEFRAEANNVLNQVSYTNIATVVNATNFGLPTAASAMRTLDIVMRFRF